MPCSSYGSTASSPLVLVAYASQTDKDAKVVVDVAVDAYDQQFLTYEEALSDYCDALSTYTQWFDVDDHIALSSVLRDVDMPLPVLRPR